MPFCEIDLRPGGALAIRLGPRRQHGDGNARRISRGHTARAARLHRVVGRRWPEAINTVTLSEEDGKTTITQTVRYPSREARDAALETGMKDGVSLSFDRLAEHVRTMA